MPNRYIRESCRTSKTLAVLTGDAERLFWRLTTVADDFGRFIAEPDVILGTCFPRQLKQINEAHVGKWMQMLAHANIVRFYEKDGIQYGYFLTWRKHQGPPRAKTSKYPDPDRSANICQQMPADSFVSESESESESVSENGFVSEKDIVGQKPNAVALDAVDRLVGFLNRKAGKGFQVKRPDGSETSTAKLVKSLLNHGYTEEQIQQVIANRYLAWGQDPKMQGNLRPSTLFRASNFDNYLGMLGQEAS